MNEKLWWYVARSSGMVAWLVLVATVVWGTLLAGRLVPRPGAPRWLTDVHRYLGGLAVALTGLHLFALAADSYAHFGWAETFVPFASSWKPGAVAWGVVAMYLLVIVEMTSLVQRRLPAPLVEGHPLQQLPAVLDGDHARHHGRRRCRGHRPSGWASGSPWPPPPGRCWLAS